ncbi:unnamed protein product [Rhizophagus irregularis]|nr:unnamed protein product [Rhizophagus irregularis]
MYNNAIKKDSHDKELSSEEKCAKYLYRYFQEMKSVDQTDEAEKIRYQLNKICTFTLTIKFVFKSAE